MRQTTLLVISLLTIIGLSILGWELLNRDKTKKTVFIPKPGKVEEIEFILIKSAFGYDKTDILKPNAAILITKKKEIIEDQQLFLAQKEQDLMSMNGYQYSIQFWKDSKVIAHDLGVNTKVDCFSYKPEDTNKRLRSYIYLLEKAPTHYIYNLKVSTDYSPKQLIETFKDSKSKILFVDDSLFRYPEAIISYEHNMPATKKNWDEIANKNDKVTLGGIQNIIKEIQSEKLLVHKSDIYLNSSGGNGETYNSTNYGVNLRLEGKTDKKRISQIVTKCGGKLENFEAPLYYSIQLIDSLPDLEKIKQKMAKYKVIHEITEYTDPYKK